MKLIGLGVVCLLLLASTAVTHAHAELLTATPAPGSVVNNPVGEVRLTFNEAVTSHSEIIVFGEDFQPVPGIVAQADSNDPATMVAVLPELEAGTYTVQWTAVSGDGHQVSGSYAFRVSDTNLLLAPRQLWLFGSSLLFIVAIVLFWRRSRNR